MVALVTPGKSHGKRYCDKGWWAKWLGRITICLSFWNIVAQYRNNIGRKGWGLKLMAAYVGFITSATLREMAA